MLFLAATLALANPSAPTDRPVESVLQSGRKLRAERPTYAVRTRFDAQVDGPSAAGLELQLDTVLFARLRVMVGPSVSGRTLDALQEAGLFEEHPSAWWGRDIELEAAWSPVPWIRVGGLAEDSLAFTRGTEQRLADQHGVRPAPRGIRSIGGLFGGGWVSQRQSLYGMASFSVPVGGYGSSLADGVTDERARDSGAPVQRLWAEYRVVSGHVELGIDGGLARVGQSRVTRALYADWENPPNRWSAAELTGTLVAGVTW